MDERRVVIIGVGVVLAVTTITLLAVTLSATSDDDNVVERENRTNPLLLISLDGFRSDYLFRYLPTLERIAKTGVWARYMMPSYPTITFPNHYTIVTGLYPESHGIVANNFYDPDFNETFKIGVTDGKWWGGEPIWNTLTRQNKTSATFFWPGSDANITGMYPTEWRVFDKSVAFEQRVDQVVEWLSRSDDTRPDWVCLYFEEPDALGHEYGPNSNEVNNILTYVDGMITRLLNGLQRNDMEDKVNIIILADHGMAASGGEDKLVYLNDYVPSIESFDTDISYGAFTMLNLKDKSDVNTILANLTCPKDAPFMRAFRRQDLPTRLHYSNNPRIGDIILDFDTGYYTPYPNGLPFSGEHGYDNHRSAMSALFLATGPEFKKNVTLEPFQNIEIYNLMCHLTGVEPAPNNGSEGALYAALLVSPDIPELPDELHPLAAEFPAEWMNFVNISKCHTEIENYDQVMTLNMSTDEQVQLETLHLPWGIPLSDKLSADILLLHHEDHVTGYSQRLKMPLWTSFTVSGMPAGTPLNSSLWLSDVRLNDSTTATCDSYENVPDVSMFPLFHPGFSANDTLDRIPFLASNAVPVHHSSLTTLDDMAYYLPPSKLTEHEIYNIMFGPVFDNDADSFPDDFANFTTPEVPSDFFAIVTYCRQPVASLDKCNEEDLDANTFIIPNHEISNNNCRAEQGYVDMFLSTVKDVELASGLTFYPDITEPSARLQLVLRIHRNLGNINVV